MIYETLKFLHVSAVVVSGTGFVVRGALMLADSPLLGTRFVRIAPHVVDTLLLGAALGMATLARITPLSQPWLAAKMAGLLVYIVLGTVALNHGPTRRTRTVALAAAVLVFAYVVGTALQRDPLWPLHVV